MSKYNLIDIFEQYKIGSGWTNDFDYEGMLNAGLKATLEDRIESLEALAEDFTDVNYHREASHLYDALEALEKGDAFEAEGKISDFHAEIRKTMESFDMDMSDDLGAYMASKMEEGEAVDLAIEASQEKAGIKEDKYDDIVDADNDIPTGKKKAAALAYRKVDKGASYKKATSHIKEKDAFNFDMKADADYDEGLEDIEEALPKFKGVPPKRDIRTALKQDAKGTDAEIDQYFTSLVKAGDEFDEMEDYVEDFKNYISDKALQEHFGRFMKDYQ